MVPEPTVPDPVLSSAGENPCRRQVFAMFVKIVVGVLVGALVVDFFVGALGGASGAQGNQSVMRLDAELGWTNAPNHASEGVTTNSLGLRSPELPAAPPPTEVRIVVAGASNTFGLAERDEDTWAPKLQGLLEARAQGAGLAPPPRVLNAGVQGYSIIQACRRAARMIELLEPDLVLVAVFPSRQAIVDTSPARTWTRVGEQLVPTELVENWPEGLRSVPVRMHRALMHSNLYRRYRAKTQFGKGVGLKYAEFILTNAEPPEPLREPLARTQSEITDLVAYAERQGVELRFLITVETRGVNAEQWATWLQNAAKAGAPPASTPMTEPFDALARFVEEAGGETWDMRDVLFRIGADWTANVNEKLHWSPPAHTLVAEQWAEWIADGGLLEELARERGARPRAAGPIRDAGVPEALLAR